jgi:hypothetical protein
MSPVKIDEAVVSLTKRLNCAAGMEDEGVFCVRHDGKDIIVDVNFIYRLKDVTDLGGSWEGYHVVTGQGRGRVSCW